MNSDLLYYMCTFLDWPDIQSITSISQRYHLFRSNKVPPSIRSIFSMFIDTSDLPVAMFVFWSRFQFLQLPVLEIPGRYGSTDYIDFINSRDMQDNRIMRGVDGLHRNFISVQNEKYIFTFFQRYTTDPTLWTVGGRVPSEYHISSFRFGMVPDEASQQLLRLLTSLITCQQV